MHEPQYDFMFLKNTISFTNPTPKIHAIEHNDEGLVFTCFSELLRIFQISNESFEFAHAHYCCPPKVYTLVYTEYK